ncbi:MAG: TonB-dependent receptor, partial [Bacteroidota bacterium]
MNRLAFHILLTASLICGPFLPSALGQQTVLDKRISLEVKERSIPEVIKLIRRQTGYFISYANHELDANKKVTQTYKEMRVEDLLRSLWKPQDIDLRVVGNTIEVRTLEAKGSGSRLGPRGNIEGRVRTIDFREISYARVSFKESNRGILTDSLGRFGFKGIEAGEYTLQISAVGYEEHELDVEVKASQTSPVEILLEEGGYSLDDVLIEGKSLSKEMAEQAIVVNTINASNIQAQTLDVAKVLDKVEGVRIRQSGGLGSTTSISINGLTGNAIRFYYNGIPSDFLGGGFQLNTLPISNVDRIEVYKGVMPANIGTDALGGGINVATNDDGIKKIDLSYQFGSFNTHRAAASITRPLGERWFINLNANYNYSDNNFEMEVGNNTYDPSLPFPTGTETIRVRRFHDAFSAFLGNALVGYSNVEKGLSVKMGVYVTAIYKELQHGIRVGFVPIGEALYRNQDSYFKLDVEKNFSDKLSFFYAGVGGYSRLQTRDSTQ